MSELLSLVVKEMEQHHATDLKVLDFKGVSPDYDYFVIGTVSNVRLAWALVDYVQEALEEQGYSVRKIEGDRQSTWILIDCFEVVIHLFSSEDRAMYGLDKLWADRPTIKVEL